MKFQQGLRLGWAHEQVVDHRYLESDIVSARVAGSHSNRSDKKLLKQCVLTYYCLCSDVCPWLPSDPGIFPLGKLL